MLTLELGLLILINLGEIDLVPQTIGLPAVGEEAAEDVQDSSGGEMVESEGRSLGRDSQEDGDAVLGGVTARTDTGAPADGDVEEGEEDEEEDASAIC
ncbi:hypothetical protein BGX26_001879, partial [Mortierella sp. AD094]